MELITSMFQNGTSRRLKHAAKDNETTFIRETWQMW
jgi:hypothetical protein